MKHLLPACLLWLIPFSSINGQNAYCIPVILNDCVNFPSYIDSVDVTNAFADFTNDGTGCNGQDYDYYHYNNRTAEEFAGDSFNVHIALNPAQPSYIGVWIDWNKDTVFGAGEQVYLSSAMEAVKDLQVNVPVTAVQDTLCMRIRCGGTFTGACDTGIVGETEDYNLIVKLTETGITPEEKATWNLYPNPATGTVTLSGTETGTLITLTDISGRVIYTHKTGSPQYELDVADLSPGMYYVTCVINGKSSAKKLIRE